MANEKGGSTPVIPADLDPKIREAIIGEYTAALPKPPETYEGIKLPDKAVIGAEALKRTTAIARELGLTKPEQVQRIIDLANGEAATSLDATLTSYRPGGAAFQQQQQDWTKAALDAPDIGGGKPEVLQAKVALVSGFVKKYFPEAAQKLINEHGIGSNPDFFRAIMKLGELSKEDGFVTGTSGKSSTKSAADKIYGGS